jgi:uncharacterized protein (TIGR00725 family)
MNKKMNKKIKNIFEVLPKAKPRIGVMGSASGHVMRNKKAVRNAQEIGRIVAKKECTLVNGACPGLPDEAAKGAMEMGGEVLGISPAISIRSHIKKYQSPIEHYSNIMFTGLGLMERDILNIRSCHGVVILPGGTGTLNEFTVAYDEGKPIGVLTGCGGVADHIPEILKFCARDITDRMVFSDDPEELISKLLKIVHESEVSAVLDDYLVGDGGVVSGIEREIKFADGSLVRETQREEVEWKKLST